MLEAGLEHAIEVLRCDPEDPGLTPSRRVALDCTQPVNDPPVIGTDPGTRYRGRGI